MDISSLQVMQMMKWRGSEKGVSLWDKLHGIE